MSDKLIGIRPRLQEDFMHSSCNLPGLPIYQKSVEVFEKIWCNRCKNNDCIRAKKGDPWIRRMELQPEYLINNPQFSKPSEAGGNGPFGGFTDQAHIEYANMVFQDLKRKADRLEIAARKQDWEIPEEPSDGIVKVAPVSTTQSFDEAAKSLAQTKGKAFEPPKAPSVPKAFQEVKPQEIRHQEVKPEPIRKPKPPPKRKNPLNTRMPSQGIMIGGGKPSPRSPRRLVKEHDPWAIPNEKTVPLGATITVVSKKKKLSGNGA